MGKKRELRKEMRRRGLEDAVCLVICGGKKCCARSKSREVIEDARAYAVAHHPEVRIEVVRCLDICKKGPIAARYPQMKFEKRVDPARAVELVDKLARR